MKFIFTRASKKRNTCIKLVEAAHAHTHTFTTHKTIKQFENKIKITTILKACESLSQIKMFM